MHKKCLYCFLSTLLSSCSFLLVGNFSVGDMCNEEKGPESDSVVSWLLIFKNYRIRQQIDDLSIHIFLIVEYLVHSFECRLIFLEICETGN